MMLYTGDGGRIVVSDQTKKHLEAHQGILPLLPEAVSRICLPDGDELVREIQMGRIVGKDYCCETGQISRDTFTSFVWRPGRRGPSRVILIDTLQDTDLVSVVAKRVSDGEFSLITAFLGRLAPREPWDPWLDSFEEMESLVFWLSHALAVVEIPRGLFWASWDQVLLALRSAGAQ